jgi:peptidoglycan/xylan/chitin deacetylase (PgdA/CDA1 family)
VVDVTEESPRLRTVPKSGGPALVISLDFELHWGVRDHHRPDGSYAPSLHGARAAIPGILECFRRRRVAATWATVGFLFARDAQELFDHAPALRPAYRDRRLLPYAEPLGQNEVDDPLHFAPSLIARIVETPRQEIGSHTFSHYYCLEDGQTSAEFSADLDAAKSIAKARGIELRSLVFPRNQMNPDYLPLLRDAGFVAYRGNPRHWAFASSRRDDLRKRAIRLVDSYTGFTGHHAYGWSTLGARSGIADIPASLFLRPTTTRVPGFDALAVRRIARAMEHAARERSICHLWWHPHNFGVHTEARLAELDQILSTFERLSDTHGMVSYSMGELANEVGRV